MNKKLLIRTDGNHEIASGHIMRCLSIAREASSQGISCCFLLADNSSASLLCSLFSQPQEFPFFILHSNYKNLDLEIAHLCKVLKSAPFLPADFERTDLLHSDTVLLIDSYFVTEHYLSQISQLLPTVYIDDLQHLDCPVDMIINYDFIVSRSFYQKAAYQLVGAAYTPLRKQFCTVSYQVRDNIQNLLLSTGGGDNLHIGVQFAQFFITMHQENPFVKSMTLHIMAGNLHPDIPYLRELSQKYSYLKLYQGVNDVAALFTQMDYALSAAGTTLAELCAIGVPTCSFCFADNQLKTATDFQEYTGISFIGDVRKCSNFTDFANKFFSQITHSTRQKRKQQSEQMRTSVDGLGCSRIISNIFHQRED